MVPDEGTPVGVDVDVVPLEVVPVLLEVVVVVTPPLPDFGRYLIPLDGQLPGVGASILTYEPSMIDPLTYGTLSVWQKRFACRNGTHVVVIVNLEEHVGVAIEANLKAICTVLLERIDEFLTSVRLCT